MFCFIGFHCGVLFPSSCLAGSQSLGFVVSVHLRGFFPPAAAPGPGLPGRPGAEPAGAAGESTRKAEAFGSFLQPEDALPLLSGVYTFENILGIFLLLILILFNCGQRKHL